MEAIETPMTSGVATPISTAPSSPIRVESNQIYEVEGSIRNIEKVIRIPSSNDDFDSDFILESAKEGDFEKTLQDLASDESSNDKTGDKTEGEDNGEKDNTVLEEEKEEKTPLEVKFEELTKRFEEQQNELKEVQQKVIQLDENKISKEELLEALLILAEIKKEEDDEKKLSLLELFVMAMTKILVEVAPKESGDYEESQPVSKTSYIKPEKKRRSIDEIRQDLMKRGLIHRPIVENQAA